MKNRSKSAQPTASAPEQAASAERALIALVLDIEIMRAAEARVRAQVAVLASQHGITVPAW